MERMTQEERETRIGEIKSRLSELNAEYSDRAMPDGAADEWRSLMAEKKEHEAVVEELRQRREVLAEQSEAEGSQERPSTFQTSRGVTRMSDGDVYDLSTIRASVGEPEQAVRQMQDRAKVAVERAIFHDERIEDDSVRTRLERMVERDEKGLVAKHLLETGSPRYLRAFSKALAGRRLNPDEERELNITTPGDGGYAVPFTLDPTVVATSDWSVNPLRAISRTETVVGSNKWQGLTSGGLTATYGYAAESTEAGDNSPSFVQPDIDLEKAQAFVPFTIELSQDWSALAGELAKMFSDAKDDVEAQKFLVGAGHGSNEPEGVVTGVLAHTPSIVTGSGDEAFSLDNVYEVRQALPPRFRPRAAWVANLETYDLIRRFSEDESNNSTVLVDNLRLGLGGEPPRDASIGYTLLGKPAYEASYMETMPGVGEGSITSDRELMLYGDFRHFVIADRMGMSVELIPHLFATNANRPNGQRAFYAHWRNSSGVIAPQAFRILVIEKTS